MTESTGSGWNDIVHPTKGEVAGAAVVVTTIAAAGLALFLRRGRAVEGVAAAAEDILKMAGNPALNRAAYLKDTETAGRASVLRPEQYVPPQGALSADTSKAAGRASSVEPGDAMGFDLSQLTSSSRLAAFLGGQSAEIDAPVSAAMKLALNEPKTPTTLDVGSLSRESDLAKHLFGGSANEMDAKIPGVPPAPGPRDVLYYVAPYKQSGRAATSSPSDIIDLTFISRDPFVNRSLADNFGVTARHHLEMKGTITDLERTFRSQDVGTFKVVDSHLPPDQQTVIVGDNNGVWTNRMVFRRDLNVAFAHSMYNPNYERQFGIPDMPYGLKIWDFTTGKFTEWHLRRDKYSDNYKYERLAKLVSGVPEAELPPIRPLVHTFVRSTTTKDGIVNGSIQSADDSIPYIRGLVEEYFTKSGAGQPLENIFGTITRR